MKKQKSTYPLRLPASLKAAVAEISKEKRDKYQSVCDGGGCRESVRYENCRVFRHARCRGRS